MPSPSKNLSLRWDAPEKAHEIWHNNKFHHCTGHPDHALPIRAGMFDFTNFKESITQTPPYFYKIRPALTLANFKKIKGGVIVISPLLNFHSVPVLELSNFALVPRAHLGKESGDSGYALGVLRIAFRADLREPA